MARSGPPRMLKRTSHEGTRQEGGHLADRGEGKGKRRSGMHANGPSKWRLLSRPGERVVQGALEMGWREAMRSPFELGGGGGMGVGTTSLRQQSRQPVEWLQARHKLLFLVS